MTLPHPSPSSPSRPGSSNGNGAAHGTTAAAAAAVPGTVPATGPLALPPNAPYVPSSGPVPAPAAPAAAGRQTGDRLPRPPRRRGAGLAALAVLLVVGGAAAAGLLALRLDSRVDVLVARHDLAPGQRITVDDLAVAPVASDGIDVIPASRQAEVVGRYASQPIPGGRLIDHAMLATSGLLAQGKAAVGVILKAGQAPANGLLPGDSVEVVKTADDGGTTVAQAVVSSVKASESGAFGTDSGSTVVTLVLAQDKAPDVAAASASGRIAVVLLQRGGVVAQ